MNANRKIGEVSGGKKERDAMNSPCTITEAVQIARGVAEDVVSDYHSNQYNIQMSMSLQIEILKEIVISAGMITEEEFRDRYMKKAEEIQKLQMERMKKAEDSGITDMRSEAGDIEIKTEE